MVGERKIRAMPRVGRVFAPGVISATEQAIRDYRREYVLVPTAVVVHPADVAPSPPRLHGLTVVRSPSVQRGQVRVVGYADHGLASIDR